MWAFLFIMRCIGDDWRLVQSLDNLATPSEDSQSSETPASCDRAVDFVVPATLPVDDKEFFDMMLTKSVQIIGGCIDLSEYLIST